MMSCMLIVLSHMPQIDVIYCKVGEFLSTTKDCDRIVSIVIRCSFQFELGKPNVTLLLKIFLLLNLLKKIKALLEGVFAVMWF